MGWLHANHGDINDSADTSDLCRRAFLDALRYARDNYLSTGLKEQQPPSTSEPVDAYAIGKHGAGWIVAYYGKAKSPSDPDSPQDSKECWRYCNTEDEVNSTVLCWRPMAPATGLTVDRAMDVVLRYLRGEKAWSPTDLRARLTEAAKQTT